MTTEKMATGWPRIRRQLEDWSKPALVTLVKDLYEASSSHREQAHFLEAKLAAHIPKECPAEAISTPPPTPAQNQDSL